MIPAYQVSPDLTLEVCFAISELGSNPSREAICEFTGKDDRRVREAIKISREFGMLENSEDEITLKPDYARDLQIFDQEDRFLVLYDALLHHPPFMQFLSYLKKNYSPSQAAQQVNAVFDLSSDSEHVETYFIRYGKYVGVLQQDSEVEVKIESDLIPHTNGNDAVDQLQSNLDSEAEIRLYIEMTVGEDRIRKLDTEVVDQLTEAFKVYASDPRKSVEESGRGVEDFLRNLGVNHGSQERDYQGASGIVPLSNHLKGDSLITETHRKILAGLAARRNRAAHGKATESLERWRITSEAGLSTALDATIIIRSILAHVYDDDQIL